MANPLRNLGGTSGDLNQVISALVNAFGPEEAAKISRSPNFGQMLASTAAPAARSGLMGGLGGAVAAELFAPPGGNALARVFKSAGGAISPTNYGTADLTGSSKYFVQPETVIGYTQWYQNEVPRIRLWNSTIGAATGNVLQEPPTPEEFARQAVERSEFQAQTFNQRLIEQERAKAEAEYAIRSMEAGFGLEGEKVKTLGDVQRQRISSGYSTAGSALNSAIENILATSKLENSPVLAEVGKAF